MTAALRVDTPQAGFYWRRFVKGGPKIPVRLWHGAPIDPETGEELERSHRWQAMVNGDLVTGDTAVIEVWISCAGNPIDEAEYDYLLALKNHAVRHEPDLPEAAPNSPIDLHRMPTLF